MPDAWKSWALTLSSAAIATTIATGHRDVIVSIARTAGNLLLWLIAPLGPR